MVSDWVRQQIGLKWSWPGAFTISIWQDCEILGAVVYESFDEISVSCHIAGVHGAKWMTKLYLKTIFAYPFEQLKVRRINVCVAESNRPSAKLVQHMGFKFEGRVRQGAPDGGDLIIYGMLREECRFLEMKHGKVAPAAAA